ncbi:hypothetical protein N9K06_00165 [Omnitrophica bacterium]|nr:hypothetical protein [Candidatus Omnitrophota bacterium]
MVQLKHEPARNVPGSTGAKKILLTSVCQPLGVRYGDSPSVGYELLHEQVTRAQGMFSPRATIHHFSLEYVAHNLETPTTVLQYPTKKQFIRELKKGYDYVGISFVLSIFDRMKQMSELVRKYSPNSKIILGGYGTVLKDEELAPYGDYFCREEGVGFLRKLLNEPLQKPFEHPLITNGLRVFSLPIGNNGMVFGGLGCPNGCDFCCTSYFFKRKHIRLLQEGDDIFELIQRYRASDPTMKFTVLDEDFLLNQKRARRFLQLVRESGQAPPCMFVFGSIKALSQYTITELLEMGVTGVWIGYEGTRSGYAKQEGCDPRELFKEFRDHGIHILASFVIGFDYQDEKVIEGELNDLLELTPTFTQILIYGPTPGTPFYDRVMQEKRLCTELTEDRDLYYKKCTGFYGMVKHPSLSSAQLEQIQSNCFRKDFEKLGPSIVRSVEAWWKGYFKLVDDPNPLLRKRAEIYCQDILNAMPMFLAARLLGPSKEARQRADRLYREIRKVWKTNPVKHHMESWIALGAAVWTGICLKYGWFQHPKGVRMQYHFDRVGSHGSPGQAGG